MKNSFTNKQTDLDLNGPYLSFDTEPQSVTGIGTTVGGTGWPGAGGTLGGDKLYKEKRREPAWAAAARAPAASHRYLRYCIRTL